LSLSYKREKFWQAVHTLATSPARIQERPAGAAQFLMRLHEPNDLPEEYRQEFRAVWGELAAEQATGAVHIDSRVCAGSVAVCASAKRAKLIARRVFVGRSPLSTDMINLY
jgi:hypothetical protein